MPIIGRLRERRCRPDEGHLWRVRPLPTSRRQCGSPGVAQRLVSIGKPGTWSVVGEEQGGIGPYCPARVLSRRERLRPWRETPDGPRLLESVIHPVGGEESQTLGQQEEGFRLCQGAADDTQELQEFPGSMPLCALGNVRGDGCSRPAQLARHSEPLLAWKPCRQPPDDLRQLHRLLPHFKIPTAPRVHARTIGCLPTTVFPDPIPTTDHRSPNPAVNPAASSEPPVESPSL